MTAQGPTDYVGGLPGGCLLNEYQIERVLGHGGFGVTYLARDTMLQKAVAIKEYLPTEWAVRQAGNTVSVRSAEDRMAFEQGQTNFLNEARVLARFHHPNLIAVYRFFQANSTAYFVMEYAEGETLRGVIKKCGTLDEEQIKELLLPVIQGLDGVHQAGIMHRDIKPENILVRKDGTAVLIDFGAARIATGSKSRAITSVLTAGYAPVEQYSTSGHQGPWTDIYALGAVMYYAICGRKPIDAISRMSDDPLVPASLAGQGRYSPEFLAAIDWALRVRAEERPQTLIEWRDSLDGTTHAPVFEMAAPIDITGPGAEGLSDAPDGPHPTVRAEPPNRTVRADATVRAENLPPPPSRPAPTARPGPSPSTTPRPTVRAAPPPTRTGSAPATRPTPTGRPAATTRPGQTARGPTPQATRPAPPAPPLAAEEAYEAAAEPTTPAAAPPARSNTALLAGIGVLTVAAAGISGWYFSQLGSRQGAQRDIAPPAAAVSQPAAAPVPAPVVDEAAERAKQQAAEKQHQQEQLKQKQAREEAERQKVLELKQQQEAADRQKQMDLKQQEAAVERQRQETERQQALQLQKQQAAEQQKKREMEQKQRAEQERAAAEKREAERVAAEKRAQELEQKKKAEAARQAKLDEEKKRKAEEEAKRAAAEQPPEKESKPKEDAPVGF